MIICWNSVSVIFTLNLIFSNLNYKLIKQLGRVSAPAGIYMIIIQWKHHKHTTHPHLPQELRVSSLKTDSEASQRSYRVWSGEHPPVRSPQRVSSLEENKTTRWPRGSGGGGEPPGGRAGSFPLIRGASVTTLRTMLLQTSLRPDLSVRLPVPFTAAKTCQHP